jgi:hypothetical protein
MHPPGHMKQTKKSRMPINKTNAHKVVSWTDMINIFPTNGTLFGTRQIRRNRVQGRSHAADLSDNNRLRSARPFPSAWHITTAVVLHFDLPVSNKHHA